VSNLLARKSRVIFLKVFKEITNVSELYTLDMNRTAPRGYIGLIGLLIAAALIGFLVWRTDLFSPTPTPTTNDSTDLPSSSNQFEQGRDAINAAAEVKQRVEYNYTQEQKDAGY
jgi:hypothetical protein